MTELKDINIGSNMIHLKDNRVVSSIFPKAVADLEQNVTIESNVIIEGAVYTNTLEIDNGPAQLKGAVYANTEIHVKNDCKGVVQFVKSVASKKNVVSLLVNGQCIYGGDINAPVVKLKNCFVCGSIYGTEVVLENSIVLGGVFATKKFDINSCIVGTFNAPEVNASGVNYLLYPTAFSVEPMSYLPGTQFWNLSLADLGSLYKEEEQKPNTGKILVDLENDTQRTILTDDNGAKMLINSYSVASRVIVSDLVDLDKFENHFLIISAGLGSQILKEYSLVKENGEKGPELTVPNIAKFFFSILSGSTEINEISGEVSFDELKRDFD